MHVHEEFEPEALPTEGSARRPLTTAVAAGVDGATVFAAWKENRARADEVRDAPRDRVPAMGPARPHAVSGVGRRSGKGA